MNLHHLELFYFVCQHQGISAAVKKMHYGIQQPAMSAQILRLEKDLGVTLFQRKPFKLTVEGERLYQSIAGFFQQIPQLSNQVLGKESTEVRIAGVGEFLVYHLPDLSHQLRKNRPDLSLKVQERPFEESIRMLERAETDFVVTVGASTISSSLSKMELMSLPLALVVSEDLKQDPRSFLKSNVKNRPPLVSIGSRELLVQIFQNEIEKKGVEWKTSIEVSSLELVHHYVREGMGVGLSVILPREKPSGLRFYPLTNFRKLPIVACWRPNPSRMIQELIQHLRKRAMLQKS